MSVYYSTTNHLGVDFSANIKDVYCGLGVSVVVGNGAKGTNYSKTMGPNAFPMDIYETLIVDNGSLYISAGFNVTDKILLNGNIGYGQKVKIYNAYDPNQILSPSGFYYTSSYLGSDILLGAFCQYHLGNWALYFGYDTYNKLKMGVSFFLKENF